MARKVNTMKWVLENSAFDGDVCLPWPYSRGKKNSDSYGVAWFNGKLHNASRVMCIVAHGFPSDPKLQAAHSCGKKICCNPRHLRWATRSENERDKEAHGTSNRGERHPKARFTASDIAFIRRNPDNATQQKLADKFNVSQTAISNIMTGKRWSTTGDINV